MGYPAFPTPQQVATQVGTATEFGIVEADGSTITSASGVLSAASQTSGLVAGPGSSVVNDFALWNNTAGTLLKDVTATVVTSLLNLFTSSLQGLVPSSSGFATSGAYLGGDVAWHTLPAQGLTYLGTVSVSGGTLIDQPSGSNIIGANNGTYRSFKLVLKSLVPGTSNVTMGLQVHSGGSFQSTSYLCDVMGNTGNSPSTFQGVIQTSSVQLTVGGVHNIDPGLSGELIVSNLAGTGGKKTWTGHTGYVFPTGPNAATSVIAGWWNGGNGAIDGFQIVPGSGTLTSGSVDIYGML